MIIKLKYIVVFLTSMGLSACVPFPNLISEDSYHICEGSGVEVKLASVRKYPTVPNFLISLQIDCDTTLLMFRQDIKAYYGAEEIKDIRLAGGVESYPCILFNDTVRLLMPRNSLSYIERVDFDAVYQPRDSISLIKGTNYIYLYVRGYEIKHRFKETVTCTFRPQWASEERKLLEIYPRKVVKKMKREGKINSQ